MMLSPLDYRTPGNKVLPTQGPALKIDLENTGRKVTLQKEKKRDKISRAIETPEARSFLFQ